MTVGSNPGRKVVRTHIYLCVQVTCVLQMAATGQTWSDKEVGVLLDMWYQDPESSSRVYMYQPPYSFCSLV